MGASFRERALATRTTDLSPSHGSLRIGSVEGHLRVAVLGRPVRKKSASEPLFTSTAVTGHDQNREFPRLQSLSNTVRHAGASSSSTSGSDLPGPERVAPLEHFSRTISLQQDETTVFVLLKCFCPAVVLEDDALRTRIGACLAMTSSTVASRNAHSYRTVA